MESMDVKSAFLINRPRLPCGKIFLHIKGVIYMENHVRSLIHIAELYYQEGLSQSAIAEILSTSRASVSRLLEEAKARGIVEIIVHSPITKDPELSSQLRLHLKLRDAIVVVGGMSQDKTLRDCSEVAVQFLSTILENNMTLGIAWGRAIQYCCDKMQFDEDYHNVHVAQMAGCLGDGSSNLGGLELSMRMAQKLNGTYSNIYAPILVSNETTHSYLIAEKQIKVAIEKANRPNIVISGVGLPTDDHSSMFRAGCFTKEERQDLIERGGEAIILARWIDGNGKELFCPGHYTIAAPLDAMREAAWSIGICASANRARAVLAALRGGYFNVLVVDDALAKELLRLTKND